MCEEKEEHAEGLESSGAGHSRRPSPRRVGEDLPPSLKSIEAELAALSPRTDRLDRERLIFLAGQESVAGGNARPAKHAGRWAWPGAFAAMTAVAAALLVMMLLRPEPQVEVRFVTVPVKPAINDAAVPDRDFTTSPEDGEHLEPLPGREEPLSRPRPGPSLLASVGLNWLQIYDQSQPPPEASYPRLLEQILTRGLDSWSPPAPTGSAGRQLAPVPYRELLDSLLDNPTSNKSLPDRPATSTFLFPGANS